MNIKKLNFLSLKTMDHYQRWDLLFNVAEPIFRDLATEYAKRRNEYNRSVDAAIKEEIKRIEESISDFRKIADLIPMSSYPHTNTIPEVGGMVCDVDFGIAVKDLNKSKHRKLEKRLIQLGYRFTRIIGGYFCYSRKLATGAGVPEIEVEIKIRDFQDSATIIALHDYLDNKLGMEERNLYTYMKHLLSGKKEYNKLKMSFFNSVLQRVYRNPEFLGNRNWFFTEV